MASVADLRNHWHCELVSANYIVSASHILYPLILDTQHRGPSSRPIVFAYSMLLNLISQPKPGHHRLTWVHRLVLRVQGPRRVIHSEETSPLLKVK